MLAFSVDVLYNADSVGSRFMSSRMMQFLRGYAAFLDYRYWFNPNPVPLGPSLVGSIFVFFAWFVAAGIVLAVLGRVFRKRAALKAAIAARLAKMLVMTGLLGLLFLFFASEQVPLFGMRFWFLFDIILLVTWLGKIVWYIVKEYPKLRDGIEERQRLEKYMPKRR